MPLIYLFSVVGFLWCVKQVFNLFDACGNSGRYKHWEEE